MEKKWKKKLQVTMYQQKTRQNNFQVTEYFLYSDLKAAIQTDTGAIWPIFYCTFLK